MCGNGCGAGLALQEVADEAVLLLDGGRLLAAAVGALRLVVQLRAQQLNLAPTRHWLDTPARVAHETSLVDVLDAGEHGVLRGHERNGVEDARDVLHSLAGDELLAELRDERHGSQYQRAVAGAEDEIEEVEGEGGREGVGEEVDEPLVDGGEEEDHVACLLLHGGVEKGVRAVEQRRDDEQVGVDALEVEVIVVARQEVDDLR